MPKILSRKRFRNTSYAYYKSHAPYYVKKPTVVSKDVEIISNKGLKLTIQTLFEDTKVVTRCDKSLGESRDLNVKGLDVGNSDGNQSSISDLPADQVSSSTVITFMNDGPGYSSVTTGVTCEHHEVLPTFHVSKCSIKYCCCNTHAHTRACLRARTHIHTQYILKDLFIAFYINETYIVTTHIIVKAVADGPVGQVLVGPLFLKLKTKCPFTKRK